MNAYRIQPLKYPWPAIFYLAAVAFGLALQPVLPFTLGERREMLLQSAGIAAAFLGVYLVVWASIELIRNRTALFSSRSAARLVIRGPFRFTRNPTYLGYTVLTLGVGLLMDNGWVLAGGLGAAVATHLYVIRKEEMHLLARFGYEFERYCRRTRAWI